MSLDWVRCADCGAKEDQPHTEDCRTTIREDLEIRRPIESLFDDYWREQDRDYGRS